MINHNTYLFFTKNIALFAHFSYSNEYVLFSILNALLQNIFNIEPQLKREFLDQHYIYSDFMKNLKKEYYLCISKCENNLDRILQKTPDDWQINRAEYQNLLKENLFKKQWVDESLEYFLYLVQLQFK